MPRICHVASVFKGFENQEALKVITSTVEDDGGTMKANQPICRMANETAILPRSKAHAMVRTVEAETFIVDSMRATFDEYH